LKVILLLLEILENDINIVEDGWIDGTKQKN